MENLIAGYKRFRATQWPEKRRQFEALADYGQAPRALVVACIDSRVDPAMIFDTAPGEILTVRNVANLVPPYAPDGTYHGTSAALEFGVRVLEIKDLIILGHGLCGGVKTLLDGTPSPGFEFIGPWMSLAREACANATGQQSCEHAVVKVSLSNLMTFPWVAERVAAGKLALHGAWFDIRIGELTILQPDGTFAPQRL